MEKKKSLAGTDRVYLKVNSAPIQISETPYNGKFKVHLDRNRVRIEPNRVVFEINKDQVEDLGIIVHTILSKKC